MKNKCCNTQTHTHMHILNDCCLKLVSIFFFFFGVQNLTVQCYFWFQNFEDFVKGHFCSRASDILVACKAYMEGAQVGCLVKGGVQDVDEGDRSCSQQFKDSLSGYMNMLVKEFAKVGAKDIDKLLPPATTPVAIKPSGVSIA